MISDPIFETYDYAIGGKMVVGRAEMNDFHILMLEDGDAATIMQLKEKLTRDMVTFMMENKLVEFTHRDDPITMRRQLMVRAYLAPSDQVKILRLAKQL
jgi:hypothetical protein